MHIFNNEKSNQILWVSFVSDQVLILLISIMLKSFKCFSGVAGSECWGGGGGSSLPLR